MSPSGAVYGSPHTPITNPQVGKIYGLARDLRALGHDPEFMSRLFDYLDSRKVLRLSSLDASKAILKLERKIEELQSVEETLCVESAQVVALRPADESFKEGDRVPPSGDHCMKIWKKKANKVNGSYPDGLEYGWYWLCSHPSHKKVHTGHSYQFGYAGAFMNLNAHWIKHHSNLLCNRGHFKVPPNIVKSSLPALACKACNNAMSARSGDRRAGRPERDIQVVSDEYYVKMGFTVYHQQDSSWLLD
jgi:hypothetical protein